MRLILRAMDSAGQFLCRGHVNQSFVLRCLADGRNAKPSRDASLSSHVCNATMSTGVHLATIDCSV